MGLTTVTRTWPPPKGTGDSIDAAWYEEYFVDFTTQSGAALSHNDTPELGGVNWLVEEDDSGDTEGDLGSIEWVSGQGLKITPKGAGVEPDTNVHSAINAPCFSVAIKDCVPNLTNHDVICIQVFTDEPVTPAANHDGYGIVVYDPASDLNAVRKWICYRNFITVSNRVGRVSGRDGKGREQNDSGGLGTVPRSFEIVLYTTGNGAVCAHSTSTSVSATPLSTIATDRAYVTGELPSGFGTFDGTFSTSSPTFHIDKSDMRLGLTSYKVSSSTSFFNYFQKVRILRLAGRAGGAD